MPYVHPDGSVRENATVLFNVRNFFWSVVDAVYILFATIFDPKKKIKSRYSSSGSSGSSQSALRRSNGPNIKQLPKKCDTGG